MSGHSKWANIRYRKGQQDSKKEKIFTKILKRITIISRQTGSVGSSPKSSSQLKLAIQRAKTSNIPKDAIERAIRKGQGNENIHYIELIYEGYTPGGVAILVECVTDNQNRTVASVRSIFNKYNGSLAKSGSLKFIFDRKSVFVFALSRYIDRDKLVFNLIDNGAENIDITKGIISIIGKMQNFNTLQSAIENSDLILEIGELQYLPNTTRKLNGEQARTVIKLIDELEENDDVQKVYHNMEILNKLKKASN